MQRSLRYADMEQRAEIRRRVLTGEISASPHWPLGTSLQTGRDTYCRDKTPAGKLEAARAMAERAEQVKGLVAEVLGEAERAAVEGERLAS